MKVLKDVDGVYLLLSFDLFAGLLLTRKPQSLPTDIAWSWDVKGCTMFVIRILRVRFFQVVS
jgi:hypothetical protein